MNNTENQTPANERICDLISQKISALIENIGIPGFAIGLVRNGTVVCAQAYGLESLNSQTPMTTESNFHMASISKAFAAVAIMQLVLKGKLDLDLPITTYIPEFHLTDDRYQQITTRLILQHHSGMPDVEDYEWDKPKTDSDAALQYLKSLTTQTLLSDPGTEFAYSNMAFELLAVLIARVSGMGFEDYADQYLFKAAGMLHSSFLYPAPSVVSQAMPHGFNTDGKAFQHVTYPYNRQHAPSSTLESNINDMNRWMNTMLGSNPNLLTAEGWDMLWPTGPELLVLQHPRYRMGLGWFIQFHNDETIVGHAGADDGFFTNMLMNPKRRTGISLMANSDPPPGSNASDDIDGLSLELLGLLTS